MKTKFLNIVMLLLPLTALFSCGPVEQASFGEKIAIEGFIEEGKGAVVWLTKSIYVPHDVYQGLEQVRDIPIRWAKVTVSDGEREEVLIGGRDTDHLLEYSYKGYDIKGEAGREYRLTVDYSGYTLTAVTTIPAAAPVIDEITVNPNSEDRGSYRIDTNVSGVSGENNYMLMAKPVDKGVYRPCLFGIIDGASLEAGESSIAVFRPMGLDVKGGYYPAYRAGEQVRLRLASIDGQAFDFWSSYMNEIINARNPIYPAATNLKSNIKGGGLGVWYGFSAVYGEVALPGEPE